MKPADPWSKLRPAPTPAPAPIPVQLYRPEPPPPPPPPAIEPDYGPSPETLHGERLRLAAEAACGDPFGRDFPFVQNEQELTAQQWNTQQAWADWKDGIESKERQAIMDLVLEARIRAEVANERQFNRGARLSGRSR
jgi:hypothetical protein